MESQFYLVPTSTGDWAAYGATFGKVPSKKQTIFGYKLHLLITLGGLILDFELAPANVADLQVGFDLLTEHSNLTVIGDKAYISAEKAAELWLNNRIRLQTLPRRNQKHQLPRATQRVINSVRQIIEQTAELNNVIRIKAVQLGVQQVRFFPKMIWMWFLITKRRKKNRL